MDLIVTEDFRDIHGYKNKLNEEDFLMWSGREFKLKCGWRV